MKVSELMKSEAAFFEGRDLECRRDENRSLLRLRKRSFFVRRVRTKGGHRRF